MLNGVSQSSQLDQFIFILRVVGSHFSFLFNFIRTFYKQTVETLISLGLHCLPMSHKKDASAIWVNRHFSFVTRRMI